MPLNFALANYSLKYNKLIKNYIYHFICHFFLNCMSNHSHKASFPATELSAEEVAQIIREVYLNATIKNKKVTVIFREHFATIEKLVKLAKQGIAEVGLAEFKSAIISSKDIDAESIKKEPEGSDLNSSICFKWWRLGDSNS